VQLRYGRSKGRPPTTTSILAARSSGSDQVVGGYIGPLTWVQLPISDFGRGLGGLTWAMGTGISGCGRVGTDWVASTCKPACPAGTKWLGLCRTNWLGVALTIRLGTTQNHSLGCNPTNYRSLGSCHFQPFAWLQLPISIRWSISAEVLAG
jgi:hypothetical protein